MRAPRGLTIEHYDHPLPGSGDGPGVVEYTKGKSITVQCSVCLRTATARDPHKVVVIEAWNFAPDADKGGYTLYRRCPDCRDARKHPID